MKKITPIIKIQGKTFTASNHAAAIKKAQKAGYEVKIADKEKIGKFKVGNKILTRKKAKQQLGISHSHQL